MRSIMKNLAGMTMMYAAAMVSNQEQVAGQYGYRRNNRFLGDRTGNLPDRPLPKGMKWFKLDISGQETPYQDCTAFECAALNLKSAQKKFKKHENRKNI